MLADRALVIRGEFRPVEGFEVTADLADKALFLFDLHTGNVFKGILPMLAERADIIIGQLRTLIEITADRAAPAFFLLSDRSLLRFDMRMIVGIGRARVIREDLAFNNICDKQGRFSKIDRLDHFTAKYRIGICRDIAQPGLARLTGGQKVESSNLSIPTIFFVLSRPVLYDWIFCLRVFCG